MCAQVRDGRVLCIRARCLPPVGAYRGPRLLHLRQLPQGHPTALTLTPTLTLNPTLALTLTPVYTYDHYLHEGQRGEAALQAHPYPYPAPTPNQGNEEKLRSKPVPDIARKYYERVSSTYVRTGRFVVLHLLHLLRTTCYVLRAGE